MSEEVIGEEEVSVLEVAEVGTPVEAVVEDVLRGKCAEFPVVQKAKSEAMKRKDAECIQLIVRMNNQVYALFPIRISNNPKSNFYKLLKQYGEKSGNVYRLRKGMKIKIVFNERGFPRVFLPV